MRIRNCSIHYFSGTGNTDRVCHRIARRLEKADCMVRLCNVERTDCDCQSSCNDEDLHIFAFPVYAFAAPAIMLRYMRALPPPASSPARTAVIAVHGALNVRSSLGMGYEGHASTQAASILHAKGYQVFLTEAVGYPANITQFLLSSPLQDQQEVIALADQRVDEIAQDILDQKRSLKRHNFLAHFFTWAFGLLFTLIGHRLAGKLYVADEKCVSCGRCAEACPAGTIRLLRGRPRWGWNCEACQRCINLCPQGAIQSSIARAVVQLLAFFFPYGLWFRALAQPFGLTIPVYWEAGALIWIAGYLAVVYAADMVLFALESMPFLKIILNQSYTRGFRRYLAPGYDPLNESSCRQDVQPRKRENKQ